MMTTHTRESLMTAYYERHGSNIALYLHSTPNVDPAEEVIDAYTEDWGRGHTYIMPGMILDDPRQGDTPEELTAWAEALHGELCKLAEEAFVDTLTPEGVVGLLTMLDDGFGTCILLAGVHSVSADTIATTYNKLHPERPVYRSSAYAIC